MRDWDFIGTVEAGENGIAPTAQRGKFNQGTAIEVQRPDGSVIPLAPAWIKNADGERVTPPASR